MKPEKQHLLHDVLDEAQDSRREATLLAGASILRRRRWRRVAVKSFTAMAALGVLTAIVLVRLPSPPPVAVTVAPPPPIPASAENLSDAQLLALFPDTPVGLITLGNGSKRLIFPRPGDEERFLKRL